MERVATRKRQQTLTLAPELFLLVELELWGVTVLGRTQLIPGLEEDMAGTALAPEETAQTEKPNSFGR